MSLKNKIYIFWGVMDLLAFASYLMFSASRGSIPFYSDIQGFKHLVSFSMVEIDGGIRLFVQAMFLAGLGLIVSLPFSAWSFLKKRDIHSVFFIVQEALRVFSLQCSVTIIPLVLHFTAISSAGVTGALFLLSETVKVASIIYCKKLSARRT